MKLQIETKTKLHTFHIGYFAIENSKELFGYTNKCSDSTYITLLDYDGWDAKTVLSNKKFLQEKYGIFFDFMFKTNKGFHLVSLDKVPFNYLREILQDSLCDPAFAVVPFETMLKSSTLRLSEKDGKIPELVMQFKRNSDNFDLSNAHFQMLKLAYPINKIDCGTFDESTKVEVVKYWSKQK